MKWRWLDTGNHPGGWNMALDEAILRGVESGESPPTFRIYGWNPSCISLGNHQLPQGELDLAQVRASALDVVRRPTGGRAVLHSGELTYSVVAPIGDEHWTHTLATTFEFISTILSDALQDVGVPSELARGDSSHEVVRNSRVACFASTGKSEVSWDGRKLIGSAQRRTRNAFLQHGSILLDESHLGITDYLDLPQDRKAMARQVLERRSAWIGMVPGADADRTHLSRSLFLKAARMLGTLDVSGPTGRELELAVTNSTRYQWRSEP